MYYVVELGGVTELALLSMLSSRYPFQITLQASSVYCNIS